MTAEEKKIPIKFKSKSDVLLLPAAEDTSKTPYAWYSHETQPGFYIRVSRKNAAGKVERRYFHRYKADESDGQGGTTKKEKRDDLGLVVLKGSKQDLEDALGKVIKKRAELKNEQVQGISSRLTVDGAWAFYATEKFTGAESTHDKDNKQFKRYLGHLGGRYLDELTMTFWSKYLEQCREGTLVVGQETKPDGTKTPVMLGPLGNATLLGLMNTAALLYKIGNKYNGLQGELKGENPPADLRENIGAPNKNTKHIPIKDLGIAWRASDQLISPWWRDMFRVFVLTGLRRSLLFGMRFKEIDFEAGLYVIAPGKRGTKRRRALITENTKPIRMPLSRYVLDILQARREFAPDKDGLVWFTPKPTRGRRTKKDAASLSDPRGAWTLIEGVIDDLHFAPHDLRRTFATAGSVATQDLFAIALLMLHTGEELAKAAGIPGITVRYMDTDEAVERMRKTAEDVTAYVLKLAAMPNVEAQKIPDPVLHPELEAALAETV